MRPSGTGRAKEDTPARARRLAARTDRPPRAALAKSGRPRDLFGPPHRSRNERLARLCAARPPRQQVLIASSDALGRTDVPGRGPRRRRRSDIDPARGRSRRRPPGQHVVAGVGQAGGDACATDRTPQGMDVFEMPAGNGPHASNSAFICPKPAIPFTATRNTARLCGPKIRPRSIAWLYMPPRWASTTRPMAVICDLNRHRRAICKDRFRFLRDECRRRTGGQTPAARQAVTARASRPRGGTRLRGSSLRPDGRPRPPSSPGFETCGLRAGGRRRVRRRLGRPGGLRRGAV